MLNTLCVCVSPVHKQVLRLHYDHYVKCVSEHHVIRVKALLDVLGENEPIMNVVNIPLSKPELLVEVGTHCTCPGPGWWTIKAFRGLDYFEI